MRVFPPSITKHILWVFLGILLCMNLSSCSRSKWVKPNGTSVSAKEQLACAEEIQAQSQNKVLEHEEVMAKVEECMITKGYVHRSWWSMKDLSWELRGL